MFSFLLWTTGGKLKLYFNLTTFNYTFSAIGSILMKSFQCFASARIFPVTMGNQSVCVCIKRISSNTESTESFFLCLPFSLFTSLHCTSIFVNLTILISLYEPSRGLRQLATQHTALFSTATLLKIKQEQYQSKSNSHI